MGEIANDPLGSRQGEQKRRARPGIGRSPHPPTVRLDDRAADRQSHTYPLGLVVKKASNSRFAISGSIPIPES